MARTPARSRAAAQRLGVAPLGTTRRPAPAFARADVVLLAVRDDQVTSVAAELAGERGWQGAVALHLSGALPASALQPLRERGAAVGSWHPLMVLLRLPGAVPAALPADTPIVVEGDRRAVRTGRALAAALGLACHEVPASAKVAYHAAATLAANLPTALVWAAGELLRGIHLPRGEALVGPLAREALTAAARHGAAAALTGPVVRGDAATLELHLEALALPRVPARIAAAHAAASLLAVAVARLRPGARRATLDLIERRLVRALSRALRRLDPVD
jgi:predicted short-subunit dehydrogenase-like oxidoreductase (DUF2520 family)